MDTFWEQAVSARAGDGGRSRNDEFVDAGPIWSPSTKRSDPRPQSVGALWSQHSCAQRQSETAVIS